MMIMLDFVDDLVICIVVDDGGYAGDCIDAVLYWDCPICSHVHSHHI